MPHQVLSVIVNALRKSKNKLRKITILKTCIQKEGLPVFVLGLVLKNNQRRRAMGTKGKKKTKQKTLSDIFLKLTENTTKDLISLKYYLPL